MNTSDLLKYPDNLFSLTFPCFTVLNRLYIVSLLLKTHRPILLLPCKPAGLQFRAIYLFVCKDKITASWYFKPKQKECEWSCNDSVDY